MRFAGLRGIGRSKQTPDLHHDSRVQLTLFRYRGDVRAVDRWTKGSELYGDADQRLRFAFQLVRMQAGKEDPAVIQSWLTCPNPELDDRVPLRLMRENDLEAVVPEVMGAARAFLVRARGRDYSSRCQFPRSGE